MISLQKWRFSWSLIATIASIVAFVSVVHTFLFPLVPPFDYFRQVQTSCVPVNGSAEDKTDHVGESQSPRPTPIDLVRQFPADSHNAVVYRGAAWKAEIGRWLSGCDSNAKEVSIVEVIRVLNFHTYIRIICSQSFSENRFLNLASFGLLFDWQIIGGNGCKNDCSGQGVCNHELGQCRCFHGYGGQ